MEMLFKTLRQEIPKGWKNLYEGNSQIAVIQLIHLYSPAVGFLEVK